MGGLGKTTLANEVYNEIKAKFDASAWSSVSQHFKVHDMFMGLVHQMMGKTMAELQSYAVGELGEMLREFLIQRRYVIVLDDVWSRDVWDHDLIRAALPDVNNRSRVLITTRRMDVAKSIDPMPYELPFLNKDESWALVFNRAFPSYQEEESSSRCPEELEGIGRRLVKRCGGLPLALEVLGGFLSVKEPNSAAWKRVAEHFDWSSTDDGGDCSKILGLSYDNLPHHHLKSCFLYLGVFPEDSVIKAQELIELWIAEGFIPQLERQLMEDTAHAYLEELANRSMIQVVDKDWLGGSAIVKSLRIHDVFRDLCIGEARENNFFNIYNTSNSSTTGIQDTINILGQNLRRLVIHGDISSTADCVKDFIPPRKMISILQFGTTGNTPAINILNGLEQLKVIHFVGMDNRNDGHRRNDEQFSEMFADIITKMRNLRYLRLYGDINIRFLPPSIQNLCNLQTLDLSGYNEFLLPNWLGDIRTLRHLYLNIYNCFSRVSCFVDVGSLTNLQTLDMGIEARGRWIERDLKNLVNIRILKVIGIGEEQGRVFIETLRAMKYLSYLQIFEAKVIPVETFSVLSKNTQLRYLFLEGTMSVQQLQGFDFGFPPNLTTLVLIRSELAQDPMATLEKLPYLRVLGLSKKSYTEKEMVCTSGGFPRLQELWLYKLENLDAWTVEDGAMPNLTVLEIRYCSNLMTLPEGLQHLRSLRTLKLDNYYKDRVGRQVGEDWYKIQHVPKIRLYPEKILDEGKNTLRSVGT